jgi:pimeloyl-ACP methyl ester carboxylesterase
MPQSHFFTSQSLRLHYVQWGDPEAPALLLIHGGRDHCRSWDWVAQELAQDWRIIVPDLRGHGDSAWSPEGNYTLLAFVQDLAQLAEHLDAPMSTIVAHSLGGNIALRYAGLYPERVRRVVSIEGLGLPPKLMAAHKALGVRRRMREWIAEMQALAGKSHRGYSSFEEALQRMKEANPNLSDTQIEHLTTHGVRRNDDGTLSWKFDNYIRPISPVDLSPEEVAQLWAAVTCPVLLCYGEDSWTSNPEKDGRASHFKNAKVKMYPKAGHWLHHDQFEMFVADLKAFL